MKTYNQFICNLAADDAEEKTEEDGVVGEDTGEGGDWQTGEELVLVQLYYLYLVREAIANPGRMKRTRGRSGEKTLVP